MAEGAPFAVHTASAPDPKVIERCEDLLQRARDGKIRAVAFAYIKPGRITGYAWECGSGKHSLDLLAGVELLRHALTTSILDEEEDDGPTA